MIALLVLPVLLVALWAALLVLVLLIGTGAA